MQKLKELIAKYPSAYFQIGYDPITLNFTAFYWTGIYDARSTKAETIEEAVEKLSLELNEQ